MSSILYVAALIGASSTHSVDVPDSIHSIQRQTPVANVFQSPSQWVAIPESSPIGASLMAEPTVEFSSESSRRDRGDELSAVFSYGDSWIELLDSSSPPPQQTRKIRRDSAPLFSRGRVVRAQDAQPDYDEKVNSNLDQPIILPPATGQPWIPPGGPMWGGNGAVGVPNGSPIGSRFGASGPQPFRFGPQWKVDFGFLPKARTKSAAGRLGQLAVTEINSELRYTLPTRSQWIWAFAPQFNYRSYNNNQPAGTTRIPSDTYRFGTDLQLTSPSFGGYTMELGFTPALTTDFEQNDTEDAWRFDGRGALFIRTSQRYMMVLGAMFWDRVNDQVLPWAGIVYTPNDRWELRAVFPNPEISFFLGTPWGIPQWWYIAGEYHIEAYQVEINQPGARVDEVQFEDWRVVTGIRSETFGYSSFLEAGWVFGRDAEYAQAVGPNGFNINSGFIVRFGLRF